MEEQAEGADCRCNAPNFSGKKLRHRSVDHVIQELVMLKERYGAKRFSIIDDEFTLSKKYATSFCQGLIDAKLNMKWTVRTASAWIRFIRNCCN